MHGVLLYEVLDESIRTYVYTYVHIPMLYKHAHRYPCKYIQCVVIVAVCM